MFPRWTDVMIRPAALSAFALRGKQKRKKKVEDYACLRGETRAPPFSHYFLTTSTI